MQNLENKIKVLETKLCNVENIKIYNRLKQDLEGFVDEIAKTNRIESRCQL